MSRLMHVAHGAYAPPAAARELTAVSADGARLHVDVHGPENAPPSSSRTAGPARPPSGRRRYGTWPPTTGSSRTTSADTGAAPRAPRAARRRSPTTWRRCLPRRSRRVKAVLVGHSMGGMTLMAASTRARFREHAAAALLCSTGSSRLVAEARVVPLRAGRLRTRITKSVLGSRAPLGPVTPVARRILKYATMGPGSSPGMVEACARIVHACPRKVRHAWSVVLEMLDLDHGVRELKVPTAVVVGTADRLTPVVHARALVAALPHCVGVTELPGLGHMTPVEAPELVTSRIRELVTTYTHAAQAEEAAAAVQAVEIKEGA